MTVVNVSVVVKDQFADPSNELGVSVSGYLGIAAALQWYGEVNAIEVVKDKIPASA
jgi:hypothetical protein